MRKPFNRTKVGKFLTNTMTGKMLVSAGDAFTGGAPSKIIDGTEDSPSGHADLIKVGGGLILAGVLIYLVVTGKITFEEAEQLKELAE